MFMRWFENEFELNKDIWKWFIVQYLKRRDFQVY